MSKKSIVVETRHEVAGSDIDPRAGRVDFIEGIGHVALVRYAPEISGEQFNAALNAIRQNQNTISAHPMMLNAQGEEAGGFLSDLIVKIKSEADFSVFNAVLRKKGLASRSLDAYDPHVLIISGKPAAADPIATCNELYLSGLVDFAQPNCLRFIEPTGTPGDPLFNSQWGYPIMKLPQAWDISTGCSNIKIAIIDNGVQLNHPDLVNNLLPGFDATGGGSGGAYKDATESHGTICAGIAAASTNNIGSVGVASSSKLLPIRAFATQGTDIVKIGAAAKDEFIVSAINYAAANAHVVSMSWKLGTASSIAIDQAIDNALTNAATAGRVLVGAAGNSGSTDGLLLPCRNPKVLTIGASVLNDTRWISSNFPKSGSKVDLVAPVPNISTTVGSSYSTSAEIATSWSTPAIAGIAALIWSVKPALTADQVRRILVESCDKVGGYSYVLGNNLKFPDLTHHNEMGHGRINALTALTKTIGGPINGPSSICTTGSFSLAGTAAGPVSWSSSNPAVLSINAQTGAATKTGNGTAIVKATINYGCASGFITKTVSVGAPDPNRTTYDFNLLPAASFNTMSAYDNHYAEVAPDVTAVTWNPLWSAGFPSGAANGKRFDFQLQPGQSLKFNPLSLTNSCGTSTKIIEFWSPWPVVVYPNPAEEFISIGLEGKSVNDALETIELRNESAALVKSIVVEADIRKQLLSGKGIELFVGDLPRGSYYLYLTTQNGRFDTSRGTRILLK